MDLSPDGRHIAILLDGTLFLWSAGTEGGRKLMRCVGGTMSAVRWRGPHRVVMGTAYGRLLQWDLGGAGMSVLEDLAATPKAVPFTPSAYSPQYTALDPLDSHSFIAGLTTGEQNRLTLHDDRLGGCQWALETPGAPLALEYNGIHWLAAGTDQGQLAVWDLRRLRAPLFQRDYWSKRLEPAPLIRSVAWHPHDSRLLAVATPRYLEAFQVPSAIHTPYTWGRVPGVSHVFWGPEHLIAVQRRRALVIGLTTGGATRVPYLVEQVRLNHLVRHAVMCGRRLATAAEDEFVNVLGVAAPGVAHRREEEGVFAYRIR
jgi:hypothetical protein